ncbi:hypothetical protein LRP52_19135 [Photobacterium sp. ZSDE20]|nr:hypothetical protein [Photobacterium sp. ZSDE20]
MKLTDYMSQAFKYINERPKWVGLVVGIVIANLVYWEASNGLMWVLEHELWDLTKKEMVDGYYRDRPDMENIAYWCVMAISVGAIHTYRNIDK